MTNTKNFNELRGLILRSTSDERLIISDEWLRGSTVLSIPEYQALRALWNMMNRKYGKFSIVISCGKVKHTYARGLSYAAALKICRDSHWKHNHNNGCEWDMEIV